MKNIIALFFLLLTYPISAQILEPVQWKTEVKKMDDDTILLLIKAKLDSGWHIYS